MVPRMRPLEELEGYQGAVAGAWYIPAGAMTREQYTVNEFDLDTEIGSPFGARILTVRKRLATVGIAAIHGNPPLTTLTPKPPAVNKLPAMINDFQRRFPKELTVSKFVDYDTWYLLNQVAWEVQEGRRGAFYVVPAVVVKPPPLVVEMPPPPPPILPPGATPAQIAQAQIGARLAAQRAAEEAAARKAAEEATGVSMGTMVVIALILIALATRKKEKE